MKIGILTHFHKSINYGGVLQSYALCKYLNDQGHSASQILYTASVKRLDPSSYTAKRFFSTLVKRLNRKLYSDKNRKIKERMEGLFSDFRDRVPHTESEYTKRNIAKAGKDFDLFIAGSDQIWNPDWYDSSYMLDFVDDSIPKVSYAASMGISSLTEEQKSTYKGLLSGFKSISVREKEGAGALGEALQGQIDVCVDPTLLLSAKEWDEVASERRIKEKYVFLYMLGDDLRVKKCAQKFARAKGLKLVFIPDLIGEYRSSDRRIKGNPVFDATPEDFISLIKNAEYVFTDSFHACVFSLLYKKEFFAFERKGTQKTSSRIYNLTEMFGCPERFCVSDEGRGVDFLLKIPPMDYSRSFVTFENERQKSMDFLKQSIGSV